MWSVQAVTVFPTQDASVIFVFVSSLRVRRGRAWTDFLFFSLLLLILCINGVSIEEWDMY